jgi:hypothetical protein
VLIPHSDECFRIAFAGKLMVLSEFKLIVVTVYFRMTQPSIANYLQISGD